MNIKEIGTRSRHEYVQRFSVADADRMQHAGNSYELTGVTIQWVWTDRETYMSRMITLHLKRVLKSGALSEHITNNTLYGSDLPEWLAELAANATPAGYRLAGIRQRLKNAQINAQTR